MTVEAIDRYMPEVLTLDGLAVMNEADTHGYRYELSPEGALSVMPPADAAHAFIVTRIMLWFAATGYTAEQLAQAVGLRIPGNHGGVGGRIPDLVVWNEPPPRNAKVWLTNAGIAVVVEIVSRGSKAIDTKVKLDEYARAGIPRYWIVDRDPAETVTMYELSGDAYVVREVRPLGHVLNTEPADHLG